MKKLTILMTVALSLLSGSAQASVKCSGTPCIDSAGGVSESTTPVTWTGVHTFNNAPNTPVTMSDGVIDSTLTATRVTFAGASGRLSDDADLTFATDTLSATKLTVATTLTSPNLVSPAGVTEAISATAPPVPANGTTAGSAVTITASDAVPNAGAGTDGAAAGGSITLTSGSAARDTSGNANAGDIEFKTPANGFVGTGRRGWIGFYPNNSFAAAFAQDATTDYALYLHSSTRLEWGTSAPTPDTIISRAAAGVVRIGSTSAIYALHAGLSVETVATTKTPGVVESAELYTNGADVDGQAITLTNDPTVGTCFEFALTSTDTSNSFAIAPSAGETLQDGASSCATSFSATAKGATARICAVSGGSGALWLVMSKNGTWTCA